MRWTRRLLVGAGVGVLAYAVFGLLTDPDTALGGQVVFLAAVVVAHDAVFMPLMIAAGFVVGRFVPVRVRPALVGAAIVSLALTLTAIPFVLGRGRRPDDPSALPLNYGRGLLITLAFVWAVAAVVAWRSWRRAARRPAA
ncbi:hypothetical protein SAMN05421812_11760 [Asanoa hainanensis]|uniref:Uncharacterized protein n=1 Tax=Asanoa hainanensis TaxID=560556 RepID=A0A239PC31_9ACTN|nr:hypothetical protein [Asanoa hainanensis]SNT64495.1 hypothetical protein SAMN05421812_11760 [Asanoa hainanensis]